MTALSLVHTEDPRLSLLKKARPFGDIEIFNNQVLVGLYLRPSGLKTKGGILVAEKTVEEDIWQTKTGLILKMGAKAFRDPSGEWFHDDSSAPITFSVGDWVIFRHSDGWAVTLQNEGNKLDCRVFDDLSIRMRVLDPDMVY